MSVHGTARGEVGLKDLPVRAGYYLFGPERALVRFYRQAIRERIENGAREKAETLSVRRFEGEGAWEKAAAEARLMSFDPCRLVLALPQGIPDPKVVTALERALDHPAPGVTLIVEEPVWSARERPGTRLGPLRKSPQAMEAAELKPPQARAFVGAYAERLGLTLEGGALDRLLTLTGHHLETCLTELEKFAACLEIPVVLPEVVDRLTPAEEDASIFPVGDALLAGDLTGALRAAERTLASGQSAFGLVGYVARQAGLLAQASRLLDGTDGRPGSDEDTVALPGVAPWQKAKLLAAARRHPLDGPCAARAILEAQLALRSNIPERLAVTELLWTLLRPCGERAKTRHG